MKIVQIDCYKLIVVPYLTSTFPIPEQFGSPTIVGYASSLELAKSWSEKVVVRDSMVYNRRYEQVQKIYAIAESLEDTESFE